MHENKLTAGEQFTLHLGDNLATLKNYPDNTFDSIVTDPPYGIEFLGKDWDTHTGVLELWQECLRVLKPGGYILAFSAARTYHQLASNIELAGFEIRDQLMWLYASGFPKAQDIGKAIQKRVGVEETITTMQPNWTGIKTMTGSHDFGIDANVNKDRGTFTEIKNPVCTSPIAQQWEGFKTALKPAHEPIVMARKPYKGSTIDNVLKNGLGALNIDATRVPWADAADETFVENTTWNHNQQYLPTELHNIGGDQKKKPSAQKGRSYATTIGGGFTNEESTFDRDYEPAGDGRFPSNVIGEVEEGYQKYFYCPKVSRKERHSGFDLNVIPTDPSPMMNKDENGQLVNNYTANKAGAGNNHPTVKPVALMDYLIKLVTPPSTPELQRKVLDPFMGSGSTGMAAVALGHHFTGCELDPKYVAIAATRIEAWNAPEPDETPNEYDNLFETNASH